jgi:hypothetical protein
VISHDTRPSVDRRGLARPPHLNGSRCGSEPGCSSSRVRENETGMTGHDIVPTVQHRHTTDFSIAEKSSHSTNPGHTFGTGRVEGDMKMKDYDLRALVQLLPPARALKKELDIVAQQSMADPEAVPSGIGEMAIRNLGGLIDRTATITEDDYAASLKPEIPDGVGDTEKVSFAKLALAQLIAYIEGQAGIAASSDSERSGDFNFNMNGVKIAGNSDGSLDKIGDVLSKVIGEGSELGEQVRNKINEALGKQV